MTVVCIVALCILCGIVGIRKGQQDTREADRERWAKIEEEWNAEINALKAELEAEKQIEHIEVEYVYKPLPVDYENIGPEMPTEDEAVLLAKEAYIEAGTGNTFSQISAAMDCPLFRVEAGYGNLKHVISAPGQFAGYNPNNPVDARLYLIAKDTLLRHNLAAWEKEQFGFTLVSTVIPSDYLWFTGDGSVNTFTNNAGGRITP